jgi:asparagine synthase (glutamine-hydrolysing)
MCGITGFLQNRADIDHREICRRMTEAIARRGPDSQGVWVDSADGIALGHRRLTIQDLSSNGAQPMISRDHRWVICYNGEIYNFPELAIDLKNLGVSLRGTSDTEVLLETIATIGVRATLEKLNGMFAFAIWDVHETKLYLARDSFGIKPLYWGKTPGLFVFGSQLTPLTLHPSWSRKLNRDAINAFLQLSYIPAPHSIYENVQKLLPGTLLEYHPKTDTLVESTFEPVSAHPADCGLVQTDEESVSNLEHLLNHSVKSQMLADVPVGAFLSGGIDSSLVSSLMQEHASKSVHTFSIGFEKDEFDESRYAEKISAHIGTNHQSHIFSDSDIAAFLPKLPSIYDEPFADSSQLPTLLVSQIARSTVKVALSGDGGDEIFGGYERYRIAKQLFFLRHAVPQSVRRHTHLLNSSLNFLTSHVTRTRNFREKLEKLSRALAAPSDLTAYHQLLCNNLFSQHCAMLPPRFNSDPVQDNFNNSDEFRKMMRQIDISTYLPDDILVKVDRASMHNGLEVRVPLLDRALFNFMQNQPLNRFIRSGKTKWLLRAVLHKRIPAHLFNRPKTGFSIPLNHWLRTSQKAWMKEVLFDKRPIDSDCLVDRKRLVDAWDAHECGKAQYGHGLWAVANLFLWLDHNHL